MNQSVPVLRISEPASLIASVPPLIGFSPADSAVLLYMKNGRIDFSARTDLPASELTVATAAELVLAADRHQCDGVILIVFSDNAPGDLSSSSLVMELETRLSACGVDDFAAYWAAEAAAGAPWGCYCSDATCTAAGTLPDPAGTVLAAHSVAEGLVTAASREELRDRVHVVDEESLTRRTALIENEARTWRTNRAAAFDLVCTAVSGVADGNRDLDDLAIARLALALQNLGVRDASLSFAVGGNAAAAEELFFVLTRECPAPYRAEAAALAAFYAYVSGRGALASIALDAAFEACPGHRLAALLRHSFDALTPPAMLTDLAFRAAIESIALSEEPDEVVS
jgi:hypothetical protein